MFFLDFTGLHWAGLGNTGLIMRLLGFTGFLLVFIVIYWVTFDLTGFHWVCI